MSDEDDTDAALGHQQELEAREREERCRQLQRELIDETKVFEESTKAFWERIQEQERRHADYC